MQSSFWNVTCERAGDGMSVTAARNILRIWAETRQIAVIQVKAHMLPRGWRIVSVAQEVRS